MRLCMVIDSSHGPNDKKDHETRSWEEDHEAAWDEKYHGGRTEEFAIPDNVVCIRRMPYCSPSDIFWWPMKWEYVDSRLSQQAIHLPRLDEHWRLIYPASTWLLTFGRKLGPKYCRCHYFKFKSISRPDLRLSFLPTPLFTEKFGRQKKKREI